MQKYLPSYTRSALKVAILNATRAGERVSAERIVNDTLLICQSELYELAVSYVTEHL